MWISSQDKQILVDVKGFAISENSNNTYSIYSDDTCLLGKYATEKRSKEVLYQIIKQIESCTSSDTVFRGVRTVSETVFQMPKE